MTSNTFTSRARPMPDSGRGNSFELALEVYENLPLRTKTGKEIQVEFVSNVYLIGSDKVIQFNIRDIGVRAESQAASKSQADTLELSGRARDKGVDDSPSSRATRSPLALTNPSPSRAKTAVTSRARSAQPKL